MAIPSAPPRDGAPAARHDHGLAAREGQAPAARHDHALAACDEPPGRSTFAAPRVGGEIVSLLDLHPEFSRRLPRDDLPVARRHLMVAVERVATGPWAPLPCGRRAPIG